MLQAVQIMAQKHELLVACDLSPAIVTHPKNAAVDVTRESLTCDGSASGFCRLLLNIRVPQH